VPPMMQPQFGGMPPGSNGLGLDANGAEAPAPPLPMAREMEDAGMSTGMGTGRPEQYVAAHPYYARRMGRAW
jgi:hypothetical protein